MRSGKGRSIASSLPSSSTPLSSSTCTTTPPTRKYGGSTARCVIAAGRDHLAGLVHAWWLMAGQRWWSSPSDAWFWLVPWHTISERTKQLGHESSVLSKEIAAQPSGTCQQLTLLPALQVSLMVHPDKCKHARAKDAFEVIGAAQKELLDEEKRVKLVFLLQHAKGGWLRGWPAGPCRHMLPGCCLWLLPGCPPIASTTTPAHSRGSANPHPDWTALAPMVHLPACMSTSTFRSSNTQRR